MNTLMNISSQSLCLKFHKYSNFLLFDSGAAIVNLDYWIILQTRKKVRYTILHQKETAAQ